tara:strand:+ start:49 stop:468 length:420 start_codon:yes stop_codon:yes gene_type:complete
MKKAELKNVLKPLIRECIKEVIFEKGVLSSIISEVALGLNKNLVTENKIVEVQNAPNRKVAKKGGDKVLKDMKSKLLESIGKDSYGGVNIFEGTKPLSSGGSPNKSTPRGPMAGIDPSDKGVDIGAFGDATDKWRHLVR